MWFWEVSCVLAIIVLAGGVFLQRRPDRWQALLLVVVAGAVVGITVFQPIRPDRQLLSAGPRQVSTEQYVSSTSCRSCHPAEHASWHASFHRTMTQRALPDAIQAPWEGHLDLNGVRHELFRRGDEFWVRTPDPDVVFRERNLGNDVDRMPIPIVERRIVMTTGSHHMQMYWMPSQGYPTELRLFTWVYQIREKLWIPYDESFVVSPETKRLGVLWNDNCIACHSVNGTPGYSFGQDRFSTEVAELGISCEACHGPGKAHIEKYQNPLHRYQRRALAGRDDSIVNPANLPHRLQTQVCGQCHSSFTFFNERQVLEEKELQEYSRNGFQFRPGQDLENSRRLLHFGHQAPSEVAYYWDDGSARIGGREYLGLVQSGCYQRGKMSCLSCHSMHSADPNDQLTEAAGTDRACATCHQDIAADVMSHTHHSAGSSGSSCYNCHMPHTSYALLGAIRSHRVDSPRPSGATTSGKPNACNLCHQDQTLQWTSHHLQQWYGIESDAPPESSPPTAAMVGWLLKGDAAQRVIAAANLGRDEPRAVSGQDWQPPLLAYTLTDDYAAIRFVAFHSLRKFEGFSDLSFEQMRTSESRQKLADEVLLRWGKRRTRPAGQRLLQKTDGELDVNRILDMLRKQDKTSIQLIE